MANWTQLQVQVSFPRFVFVGQKANGGPLWLLRDEPTNAAVRRGAKDSGVDFRVASTCVQSVLPWYGFLLRTTFSSPRVSDWTSYTLEQASLKHNLIFSFDVHLPKPGLYLKLKNVIKSKLYLNFLKIRPRQKTNLHHSFNTYKFKEELGI